MPVLTRYNDGSLRLHVAICSNCPTIRYVYSGSTIGTVPSQRFLQGLVNDINVTVGGGNGLCLCADCFRAGER